MTVCYGRMIILNIFIDFDAGINIIRENESFTGVSNKMIAIDDDPILGHKNLRSWLLMPWSHVTVAKIKPSIEKTINTVVDDTVTEMMDLEWRTYKCCY